MTDNHLRTLLDEASADVPAPHLTPDVLAGVRRRRERRRIVVATACAAAGVTGIGLALQVVSPGGGDVEVADTAAAETAERAPVNDTFTCENTLVVPPQRQAEIFGEGPDFGLGHYGAARYEVVPTDNGRRFLEVGDAKGDLTARVRLRRDGAGDDNWVVDGYERCTGADGDDVTVEERFRLGAHGRAIPEPPETLADGPLAEEPTSSVLPVDDRGFYNLIGVVDHRTLYAYETETGVVVADVVAGQEAGAVSWSAGEEPSDVLGPSFIPSHEHPDIATTPSFVGWAYYTREQARLTGLLADGTVVEAKRVLGYDWRGTLHIVLAHADDLESVTLRQNRTEQVFEVGTR